MNNIRPKVAWIIQSSQKTQIYLQNQKMWSRDSMIMIESKRKKLNTKEENFNCKSREIIYLNLKFQKLLKR
jgi:hypothetical protein